MLVFQICNVKCKSSALCIISGTESILFFVDMELVLQRRLVVFGLGSVALRVRAMLFVY